MKRVTLFFVVLGAVVLFAQSPQHKATLNFVFSPDTSSSNVYRAPGVCPATGAPSGQVKLTSVPITTNSYVDTTVAAAQTYCYSVRAVSPLGFESVDSNYAQVTIPLAPPTGLSVAAQ